MHSRAPLLTVSVELNAFLHQCIHGGRDHLARWCIAVPTSVTPTEVLPSPCARSIEGLRVSEACMAACRRQRHTRDDVRLRYTTQSGQATILIDADDGICWPEVTGKGMCQRRNTYCSASVQCTGLARGESTLIESLNSCIMYVHARVMKMHEEKKHITRAWLRAVMRRFLRQRSS
jgi:hypothetical protein